MTKIKATFVTVWDDSESVHTHCEFDTNTNNATDVEMADVEGMDIDIMTDEYVLLPDGREVRAFTIDNVPNDALQDVIDDCLEVIKDDIAKCDLTAIDELLKFVPVYNLVAFLPDDQMEYYKNKLGIKSGC